MIKRLALILSALFLASSASAQVVSQGRGGTSPWLITFDGGQPVTGPQTDAQARTPQTNTGTLDGNGDTVELEMNGATGASAMFPDAGSLDGSVVFEASYDGGTAWDSVQANPQFTWDPINRTTGGANPSNYTWHFALNGGETHVRVRVTAYTSGTVDPVLTGTYTPSSPVQNAMFSARGGNPPMAAIMVGGRAENSFSVARTPSVRSDAEGSSDQGWVVWDMATSHRVGGAMTGARDFGAGIGGRDASDTFVFGELRDTTPASDTMGLVVRGVGTFEFGATDLDIRDLVFASDKVDVTGSDVTVSNTVTVDGSGVTQPVSAAALPLPAGAATAALQLPDGHNVIANAGTNLNTSALLTTAAHDAALGTAGTADAQVRSVQGITGMTPLDINYGPIDSSVSGTVTPGNAGTAFDVIGKTTAFITVSGTWNAVTASAISFEVSEDNVTWGAVPMLSLMIDPNTLQNSFPFYTSDWSQSNSVGLNGTYVADVSGASFARINWHTAGSGSGTFAYDITLGKVPGAMAPQPVYIVGNSADHYVETRIVPGTSSIAIAGNLLGITNALPAGTNNIGDVDVASIAAGDNNIGNVDVVSQVPGTGSTNLGKAEDAGHTTANTGVFILGVRNDGGSTQTTSADAEYAQVSVDAYGAVYRRPDHPNRFSCTISSTATTSAIVTGCTAPGAGLSRYVTSLQWHSSIISTTTNFMTIQSGTDGNCGASVDVLYRGYAQVAFSGREVVFQTPIKAPANEEICLLHPGAGTRLVNIQGFIAP